MSTGINISGNQGSRGNDVALLADAIECIIQAGGDREVTLAALHAFEMATRVDNTINNCSFDLQTTASDTEIA